MNQLEPTDYGIGEEEVTRSQPMVRALLVQRLEQIWLQCEPHVTGVVKPDPRFIEAGIRVLDRLSKLYRLDAPMTPTDPVSLDPTNVAVTAAISQIQDIEARMRESEAS